MPWSKRRKAKCQICNEGEVNNFTLVGRKRFPKYFCSGCSERLRNGERVDVAERTLKKICHELDYADSAGLAAYKLLLLRDPRSADALYAYLLKKNWAPSMDAKLALAAIGDPRAEPAMQDELEVNPEWRKFARNQRTPDDVCDGIVVARTEPGDKEKLELLTLAKDPGEAINQIADILNYPSDHPVRTGGLAAVYRPGTRLFSRDLTLFHASRWTGNPRPPEDAILRWCGDSRSRERDAINWIASKFAGTESRYDVWGTAVLSGFDVRTATIRSVPVRALQYDLTAQAYRSAAGSVYRWRKERGL